MDMTLEQVSIISKTKELCAAIIEDSEYKKFQADTDRFLSNDEARLLYQSVHDKGEELHHKQHAGVELSPAEIKAFQDIRDNLFENKIASDFMNAQRGMEGIEKEISKYIKLTVDMGRVPTEQEVEEASAGGCCGGSCGGGSCSN